MVGDGLLMTNRHVAELFAKGLGREALSFIPGQSAAVDFLRERDRPDSLLFQVRSVAMVHPYWDMALLEVDGLASVTPLSLSTAPPGDLRERDVVVVGYPALDPRNAVDVQNRIFDGVFNVKRLQPGKLRDVESIRSFGHAVEAVTHDSSTLGGNSGSAVVDVKTGEVVGLHFAGIYLEANYAVPSHELALDPRMVDAGVNFDAEIAGGAATSWDSFWTEADPEAPRHRRDRPADRNVTADRDHHPDPQRRIRCGPGVEALVEPFTTRTSRTAGATTRDSWECAFRCRRWSTGRSSRSSTAGPTGCRTSTSRGDEQGRAGSRCSPRRTSMPSPARKTPEPGRDYTRAGLERPALDKDQEKWFTDPGSPRSTSSRTSSSTRTARPSTRATS